MTNNKDTDGNELPSIEEDVKLVGTLLKAYGFKRVTIMRKDGTVEEVT